MTAGMQAARWKRVHGLQWSRLVCFTLVLWTRRMEGLADFSNYLSRILTNQHALAWDGQPLRLHCPRHSTVSVLSAFYGSGGGGGDDARPCGGGGGAGAPVRAENSSCSAFTALQKLMSVCQSQRQCSLPVSPLLFGRDPCPGTRKYLTVVYKCKPTEHKRLAVCEGGRLMLRCKPPRVLNIYAAVYGREPDQTPDTCPPPQLTATRTGPPPFECLNHEAVHTVSQSCYSKQRCAISRQRPHLQGPLYPGNQETPHLPETLLRAADPELQTPASPTPDLENGPPVDMVATFPKGPHLPTYPGAMMSDSLMTYGYIKEHPETAALLFTCSVCVGLLLTLLAVSVRVTCRPGPIRCHAGARRRRAEEEEAGDDDDKEEEGTGSSLISTKDRKSIKDWEEVTYVSEAAERAERMERREMVMQEIWMNAYMNGAPEELARSDI
ncbi:Protein eva-1 C [Merluccius polli]|uniref:Protein eva-1 C n=1 Tax=Merluccius polli TaxID=89951 RepID=A0AA47M101_MERPO|nr:Protein eva-1 C [Merluccius polli]